MPPKIVPSRVHLLVAKEARTVVLIQRKRTTLFHVAKIDTRIGAVEHGSWFRGRLFVERCDVSFDGRYMVYLAMGAKGVTWNGVCEPPWLTTLVEAENFGTWGGGGHFTRDAIVTSGWREHYPIKTIRSVPFSIRPAPPRRAAVERGEVDFGPLTDILARDGFERLGSNWGSKGFQEREGDAGWGRRPTPDHPLLNWRFVGFRRPGAWFRFALEDHPGLLDDATSANWDVDGALWVARPGLVERHGLAGKRRMKKTLAINVDAFERPINENGRKSPRPASR